MTTDDEKKNDNDGRWDALLTEEPKDDEEYIKPNIETKLSPQKRKDCRDILQEIKTFGVSQRQMLYLIYLMSLELEDATTLKAITKAIGENRENTPVASVEASRGASGGSKIILGD